MTIPASLITKLAHNQMILNAVMQFYQDHSGKFFHTDDIAECPSCKTRSKATSQTLCFECSVDNLKRTIQGPRKTQEKQLTEWMEAALAHHPLDLEFDPMSAWAVIQNIANYHYQRGLNARPEVSVS